MRQRRCRRERKAGRIGGKGKEFDSYSIVETNRENSENLRRRRICYSIVETNPYLLSKDLTFYLELCSF